MFYIIDPEVFLCSVYFFHRKAPQHEIIYNFYSFSNKEFFLGSEFPLVQCPDRLNLVFCKHKKIPVVTGIKSIEYF